MHQYANKVFPNKNSFNCISETKLIELLKHKKIVVKTHSVSNPNIDVNVNKFLGVLITNILQYNVKRSNNQRRQKSTSVSQKKNQKNFRTDGVKLLAGA